MIHYFTQYKTAVIEPPFCLSLTIPLLNLQAVTLRQGCFATKWVPAHEMGCCATKWVAAQRNGRCARDGCFARNGRPHRQFSILNSQFSITPHSPFTVHPSPNSQFSITPRVHRSLFTLHPSLFTLHRSPFTQFSILNYPPCSPFTFHPSLSKNFLTLQRRIPICL